ncbi:hypothetical protein [Oceanobacillus jeddahense]|uniref:Uncharacterized protein n=1 Tax=Oceanobacillus jeddahense TaxID=1462527 RepID=A0ABY5JRA2_9BACI|nr:hypothetical protein [Oceanobacillus jeddahense]UUI02820.1 hypothetical protein NP439_22760 [Oceanobacillus jeddahense]
MLLKKNPKYVSTISMILTIILAQPIGQGILGLYIDLDLLVTSNLAYILFIIALYYIIYVIVSFLRTFKIKWTR